MWTQACGITWDAEGENITYYALKYLKSWHPKIYNERQKAMTKKIQWDNSYNIGSFI